MSLPVVFMFSGQGSQYYRMGKELFDENVVFADTLRRYDAVVAEELGASVLAHVFDPAKSRHDPLLDTRITHPGIVMIGLALAETVTAAGIEPAYLLGASLGEYTAAVVSGSVHADDCLRLLVRQADALKSGPGGGMLAVLAEPDVLDRLPALRDCEIAARNAPGHFVVAGTEEELTAAEAQLRAADVVCQRVSVEHGFHSRLMDNVIAESRATFDPVRFRPPRIPWVSCVDGGLVERATADHFCRVARLPIEFERTMAAMRERGEFLYLDLGPSGSMHNFVRGNLPSGAGSTSLPLLSPFGYDPGLLARARAMSGPPPTEPRASRKEPAMKVYGFPGQGSQRRGMGTGLFEKFPEHTAIADRVLGYSVEELCTADPERRLARTEYTQPALYVVGALSYLDRMAADPVPPDYLVGHSLGEYVALFAAGAFDFETGLRLVRRRGELMAAAGGGAMAAVVGLDEAAVRRTLADAAFDGLDLANHNAMDQFVVSGPGDQLDAACAAFETAGARTVRLHVSAPLHSRYMRATADAFAEVLDGVTVRPPTIPVLANVDARPYQPDAIKRTLVAQIASPVRWTETVRRLMGHGDFEFVELGPGTVLTKLVQRIRNGADPIPPAATSALAAGSLGARSFRDRYGLRRAYLAGSMYGGVSGRDMVRSLAKAGLLGFFGAGGLSVAEVDEQLGDLTGELGTDGAFGVNLMYRHGAPQQESALVDVVLRHGVDLVEASGFPRITPALARLRLKGGRIIAKVSRTDVAAQFLAPPPEKIVARLVAEGAVTAQEARAGANRPMADDVCVTAAGGWLSDTADLLSVLPAVLRLRDRMALPGHRVHVGCAGGIGTPEAAATAFLLGAEFVVTGSVNQCSIEAATSDAVKDILQQVDEYDVDTAPWGEMFEAGVRASYVRRGVFFPARAARLYELWRAHDSLAELDDRTRAQVLDVYLGGTTAHAGSKAELAALFGTYFERGFRLARTGEPDSTVDYLIHCGPSMGAFNRVVAGTSLQPWRARGVEAIADVLMDGAAGYISERLTAFRTTQEGIE